MKIYIGTKVIHAEPAPKNGEPGYKVEYEDGHISWSPKAVFEAAYQTNGKQSFGHAIDWLRRGEAVTKDSWDDGDYLYLVPAIGRPPIPGIDDEDEQLILTTSMIVRHHPNGVLEPWSPSQNDMLSTDWGCLNEVYDDDEDNEDDGIQKVVEILEEALITPPPSEEVILGSDSEAEGPTSEAAAELGVALTLMLATAYTGMHEFTRDHAKAILYALENGVRIKVFEYPES